MRSLLAVAVLALAACAPNFPTGDISQIVEQRNATFVSRGAASYTVYGGYGSACAHPGAHVNFDVGTSYTLYAALDGVISEVQECVIAGAHDKAVIRLAIGVRGGIPVYLDYNLEPFGGKVCSAASAREDYFRSSITVKQGDRVRKGDRIGTFTPLGAGAHLHLNLEADGATICPEIFSAASLADTANITGGLSTSSCGGSNITSGTLCHQLTESEDPSQVLR